jgi:hypothetical protein
MEGTGSHSQLLWWGWWSLVVLVGMMVSSEDEAGDLPNTNSLRKGPSKPGAYVWCCFTRGPYHNKRSSARCKACGRYWAQPRVSQLEKHIIDECRGEDLTEDQHLTHIVLIAQSKATFVHFAQTTRHQVSVSVAACDVAVQQYPIHHSYCYCCTLHNTCTSSHVQAGGYVLGGRLLANECTSVKARLTTMLLSSNNLTLNFDGWSDIEMHSVLGANVITPDRREWVLGTLDCGGDSHGGVPVR